MRNIKPRVGDIAPVTPNWQREVEIEHAFLTEIRTSRDGTEQREAVRSSARVSLNFNVAVAAARAQRVVQDILRNQTDPWLLPVSWRQTSLVAPAQIGEAIIAVSDPAPWWAVVGARLVLQGASQEAVEVAAVVDGLIYLAAPLAAAHGAGTRVQFAYRARFPDSLRFRAENPSVYTAAVRMEGDPARNVQPIFGTPDGTYSGLELFLRKPNWMDKVDFTISREREVADFTHGRISVVTPLNFSMVDRRVAVYGFDAERVESVLGLFLRTKGRRGSFWAPSWTADARPRGPVSAGATFYEIDGTDFAATFSGSRTHNRIICFFPDGSHQINTVSSVTVVSGRSRLTFGSAWTRALSPESRIHWLFRTRFAGDTLTQIWSTATVGKVQFSLISLPTNEAVP